MSEIKEEFKGSISELLHSFMAEKEEAEKLAKAEVVLREAETTIGDLTDALSAKNGELAAAAEETTALKERVAEFTAKVEELERRLAETTKEVENYKEKASKAEEELANIARERRLELRVRELSEAKVLAAEAKLEEQKARVRDMSDEEFKTYLAERVELREYALAEYRAEVEQARSSQESQEEVAEETGEEVVEVAPADLEGAQREQAAAILNVELVDDDLRKKFARLGDALANKVRKSYE